MMEPFFICYFATVIFGKQCIIEVYIKVDGYLGQADR